MLGLALLAIGAELKLRHDKPFMTSHVPTTFVDGVGVLLRPNAEVRFTNGLDFWVVARSNSLGFLDREPIDAARAAASCHVTILGDSFVQALEVPIADKVQVRLEALAERALPHLDVTTSAFGRSNTAQASQLPFYDHYARRLSPKLVVLLFAENDVHGNHPLSLALRSRWNPDALPFAFPAYTASGDLVLRPPVHSPAHRFLGPVHSGIRFEFQVGVPGNDVASAAWLSRVGVWLRDHSYFAKWLGLKLQVLAPPLQALPWRESFGRRVGVMQWLRQEELAYTAFAFREFAQRAARDGARLLLMIDYGVDQDTRAFKAANANARELDIPMLSLPDYLARRGLRWADAHFPHDLHWNATGHLWAAEALLAYIEEHPAVCAT